MSNTERVRMVDALVEMTAERDALAAKVAAVEALGAAVVDTCWRVQPSGEDADGFISMYLVTSGTVHRLIGAAQQAGFPAAFRVIERSGQEPT